MQKPKIGISVGDLNGVGLEVILKTLADDRILNICTPIIYGSTKVVSYHKNIVDFDFQFYAARDINSINYDKVNVLNCWQETVNITLGNMSNEGAQYAVKSLEAAVNDWKYGFIDALVTAPIHKKAMELVDFKFTGHTEYLTDSLAAKESLMLMVSDTMKIGLVTNHLPIHKVPAAITKEKVLQKIQLFAETLKMDFGKERPTIAVLGLNPHAGDNGLIGQEEEKIIRPAVVEAKKTGSIVTGPFPADGFFGSGQYNKYDGILAMYHDQGLIPFKTLSFGTGVNYTAGLSAIRTSPDHGTAYDIAGQNIADPSSFRKAIFLAIDIVRTRKEYFEYRENALENAKNRLERTKRLQKNNAGYWVLGAGCWALGTGY
ncbi:MAG: 4-hydroxythreonine-4-phosphate dehydrogenase PdxA [Saprospiraceae bacterium]